MPSINLGGQEISTSNTTGLEIVCHPTTADELDEALRIMLALDDSFGRWGVSNVGTTLWVTREIDDQAQFTVFAGTFYHISLAEFEQRIIDLEREAS